MSGIAWHMSLESDCVVGLHCGQLSCSNLLEVNHQMDIHVVMEQRSRSA
jgi:hypothetical protein